MKKMFTCLNSGSQEQNTQSETTLSDLTDQDSFQQQLSTLIHDDIHSSITKIVNSSRELIINKFEDNLNNIELLIINNVISNITSKIENRFETRLNDLDKHIQTLFHKMNNVKDIDGLSSMFSSKIDSMFASKLNVIDAHFNTLSQKMKELKPEELDAFRITTSPKPVNSAVLQDAAEAAEIFFESDPGVATEEPAVVEAAPEVALEALEEPLVLEVVAEVEALEEPLVAVEEPVVAEAAPEVALEAVEEPVLVEAAPEVSVEAVEEPVAVEAAPEVALEAVEEPVAVEAAPEVALEAAEEPVVAEAAPEVALEAVEEQAVALEAVEEPVVALEAVEEAVVALEADPEVALEPVDVPLVSLETAEVVTAEEAEEIIKTPTFLPKSSLKMLVAQYHKQITAGCGKSNCTSDSCASNPDITLPSSPTSIVRMAINLTKSKAPLCGSASEEVTNEVKPVDTVLEEVVDAIAETVVSTILAAMEEALLETIEQLTNKDQSN